MSLPLLCRFLGRRDKDAIHTLGQPASEKRQGTKSREGISAPNSVGITRLHARCEQITACRLCDVEAQTMNIGCPTASGGGTIGGKKSDISTVVFAGGGPERSRTSNLRFRKPLLRCAELRGKRKKTIKSIIVLRATSFCPRFGISIATLCRKLPCLIYR